jgi:hypothetical protein
MTTQDRPTRPSPTPPSTPPRDRKGEHKLDEPLTAAERDEAQTERQAPDNASPGEAAGG